MPKKLYITEEEYDQIEAAAADVLWNAFRYALPVPPEKMLEIIINVINREGFSVVKTEIGESSVNTDRE
jgi:hypothetical protein